MTTPLPIEFSNSELFLSTSAKLIGPSLTRVSLSEWNTFIREFVRRPCRDERLGRAYLKRYSRFGYTNDKLLYASNTVAFYMLDNYVRHGSFNRPPEVPTYASTPTTLAAAASV